MSSYLHSCRVIVLGGFLFFTFLPIAASADQIVVLVDENGHKIYVNTGETSNHGDWMSHGFRASEPAGSGHTPANIDELVEQTASSYQVDPELIRAIIRVESGYDAKAVSNKGAMGLMQLVPATAQRFGVANPFDPKQNLEGGVNYLKHLLDIFGGDLNLSLAAYNAGEHTVQRSGGNPGDPRNAKLRAQSHQHLSARGRPGAAEDHSPGNRLGLPLPDMSMNTGWCIIRMWNDKTCVSCQSSVIS